MADISKTGAASPTAPLPARTGPIPTAKPSDPQAKIGTDALALTKAAGEFQYFGHAPKVTLTMLLKQPVWGDDRTKITYDQWAQMPEAQREKILAMIPNEPAKAQFVASVDPVKAPALVKAKAELSGLVKGAWDGAQAWSKARQPIAPPPAAPPAGDTDAQVDRLTDAQVDRLNEMIEAGDKK